MLKHNIQPRLSQTHSGHNPPRLNTAHIPSHAPLITYTTYLSCTHHSHATIQTHKHKQPNHPRHVHSDRLTNHTRLATSALNNPSEPIIPSSPLPHSLQPRKPPRTITAPTPKPNTPHYSPLLTPQHPTPHSTPSQSHPPRSPLPATKPPPPHPLIPPFAPIKISHPLPPTKSLQPPPPAPRRPKQPFLLLKLHPLAPHTWKRERHTRSHLRKWGFTLPWGVASHGVWAGWSVCG